MASPAPSETGAIARRGKPHGMLRPTCGPKQRSTTPVSVRGIHAIHEGLNKAWGLSLSAWLGKPGCTRQKVTTTI
jgi:hypothetical protein